MLIPQTLQQYPASNHSRFHSRGLVAEVPHSLTGVLGAAQKHGVGALGRTERQLVKSDALSASRQDAGASGFGKPEGAHCRQ